MSLDWISYYFAGVLSGFWVAVITIYIASKDMRAKWNKQKTQTEGGDATK